MSDGRIHDFHAHIYFDEPELERAKALAAEASLKFGLKVGHFHVAPVGPHPRGSVQLTVPVDHFGEVATWMAVNRNGLTIFAHASTGDHIADHSKNAVWFGPSEPLDMTIFA